jgi:hypothetical protein
VADAMIKARDHTVKNVLLVNALLVILFLSDSHGGRVHDLRIAEGFVANFAQEVVKEQSPLSVGGLSG